MPDATVPGLADIALVTVVVVADTFSVALRPQAAPGLLYILVTRPRLVDTAGRPVVQVLRETVEPDTGVEAVTAIREPALEMDGPSGNAVPLRVAVTPAVPRPGAREPAARPPDPLGLLVGEGRVTVVVVVDLTTDA